MHIKRWLAILAVLALVGCSEEEGRRVPIGEDAAQTQDRRASWPEGLAARVDSANLAYSNQDYETAAEIYRGLTEEHPEIGTVWFGLYMAENALGNTEAAETALERAEAINPGLGRMHDEAESQQDQGGVQMPAGHPPLDSVNPEDAPPLTGQGG